MLSKRYKWKREMAKSIFPHVEEKRKRYIGEEKEVLEAVVEMEDGFVMTIQPRYMRFIDRDKSEFEIDSRNNK